MAVQLVNSPNGIPAYSSPTGTPHERQYGIRIRCRFGCHSGSGGMRADPMIAAQLINRLDRVQRSSRTAPMYGRTLRYSLGRNRSLLTSNQRRVTCIQLRDVTLVASGSHPAETFTRAHLGS